MSMHSHGVSYEKDKIIVKSLEDDSVLFHGVIEDLKFLFYYSPDDVISNNTVEVSPSIFKYTSISPHNILGEKNQDLVRWYSPVITKDDSFKEDKNYSGHLFSIEKENGPPLFHARLAKVSTLARRSYPRIQPYWLKAGEISTTGQPYLDNKYYCPIKQLIAAGQDLEDCNVEWADKARGQTIYNLAQKIKSGKLMYPDGRIVYIDDDRATLIERDYVILHGRKDGYSITRQIWYTIETKSPFKSIYEDETKVRVTFESDFAENARFVFDGTFTRDTKKRDNVNHGNIAFFHIKGEVSTVGREGGEIKKDIDIYAQKELENQNYAKLFDEKSVFPPKNNLSATVSPTGLDDLIGLGVVKETFKEFKCFGEFLINKNKKIVKKSNDDRDMLHDIYEEKVENFQLSADDDSVALHMAFLGSPGTGKTTVAERVAAMLKACGLVVQNEKPVVVVKSDLVGVHIGSTEEIVRKKINEAMGGILFVDEAYALFTDENDRDFGHIAINEIMYAMERYRDKIVVILAGYTDEMLNMLKNANPGLASRIPWMFRFEDYSASEMWDILNQKVGKGGFKFENEDSAKELATRCFDKLKQNLDNVDENGSKKYYFGNGRGVRTFYQYMQIKLAVRCSGTDVDDQTFTHEDIEYAYDTFMHNTEKLAIKRNAANKIGFS